MSLRRTTWTAATSYAAMGSGMITSLLLVRVATQTLSPEEFGLWSFCFGTVGYFLLMDFGVTNSLGRMFADAVVQRDHAEMSGWLYLTMSILAVQAVFILAIGLLSRDALLTWFAIPPHLLPDAKKLWTWLIFIQACAMPLRALPAFLYAQNRVYQSNIFTILSSWINLALFWWWIGKGAGVQSYAYAACFGTAIIQGGYLISIFIGKERLRLQFVPLPIRHLRGLFTYSFAIFIQSLTTQAAAATQGMILTKLLGLDAVATFGVTARLPNLFGQLIWKPYDACVPRWMLRYCANDFEKSRQEIIAIMRLTVLAVFAGAGIALLVNSQFIGWWTKPGYFGGNLLTFLLGLTLLTSTLQHCLSFAFHLNRKMTLYTIVLFLGFLGELGLGIVFVNWFGLIGIPAATLCVALAFVLWFHVVAGGRIFGINVLGSIYKELLGGGTCLFACFLALIVMNSYLSYQGPIGILLYGIASLGCCLPLIYRGGSILKDMGFSRLITRAE